jgi:hypothetical protein
LKDLLLKIPVLFKVLILILFSLSIITLAFYLTFKFKVPTNFYTKLSSISTTFAAVGGIALLVVTYFTFQDGKQQREIEKEPIITLRLIPDNKNSSFVNFSIKNTGGGPAYDLSISFAPNVPYNSSTLNELNMFKRLPLLDKDEQIEFFFASLIEYYNSDKPKNINAVATYYTFPKENKKAKKLIRSFEIFIEERKGQMQIIKKDLNDLVKEIEELKHFIAIKNSIDNDKIGNDKFEIDQLKKDIQDLKELNNLPNVEVINK